MDILTDVLIVGGGAAGYFTAINIAIKNPNTKITIIEQSKETLNKVRISGGGRCNVTHACYDPKTLVNYYPRGNKELLSPFYKFNPTHTIEWFAKHNVALKTEQDGRIFPVSDNSETIIKCFSSLINKYNISVFTLTKFISFTSDNHHDRYYVSKTSLGNFKSRYLVMTPGSSSSIWKLLSDTGYEIENPVPSLFTFNLPKHPITELMGVSVPMVNVSIKDSKIKTTGPLLITHWGLSGPAILRASSEAAILLANNKYEHSFTIDWGPNIDKENIMEYKQENSTTKIEKSSLLALPNRLWQFIVLQSLKDRSINWASISKVELQSLITNIKAMPFVMKGKTTFKEEFVTAGGVVLKQINFSTFESKIHSNLYMAGEILNIDAVTGGFNFQAAWTGGYIIAESISNKLKNGIIT